ncbi:MAG: site-2 protease family protein [Oscillospiraceae bacterium]|nr:site-2 protease family protein [Oscillospiraceae bacterium]
MPQSAINIIAHIIVLLTIPFHEVAHGLVSLWLGDPTAKMAGRLTLNPLRHLDLLGSLSMLILGVGWAKPVPIDVRYYKNRKLGMAVSAAAGPLSNVLLAYLFLLAYKLCAWAAVLGHGGTAMETVCLVLYMVVLVNLNLAVFNLLPVPPFDGSRIIYTVLPETLYFKVMKYERYIMLALLAVFYIGILDAPLYWLRSGALAALDWASGYMDVLAYTIFA